jgi:hypothetical protein
VARTWFLGRITTSAAQRAPASCAGERVAEHFDVAHSTFQLERAGHGGHEHVVHKMRIGRAPCAEWACSLVHE